MLIVNLFLSNLNAKGFLGADVIRGCLIALIAITTGQTLRRAWLYYKTSAYIKYQITVGVPFIAFLGIVLYYILCGILIIVLISERLDHPLTWRTLIAYISYISLYAGNAMILKYERKRMQWLRQNIKESSSR